MTDAPTDAQLWLINTTYCENAGQLLKQIELCFKTVKDAKILYRLEYMHGFFVQFPAETRFPLDLQEYPSHLQCIQQA